MIFKDLLIKYGKELHSEFELILKLCFENQFHYGDLLLWKENGFFQEELKNLKDSDGKKYNPHVIGPGTSGHSEYTHYEFINHYRHSNIYDISYAEYLEKVKYSPDKKDEIDKLHLFESTSIQIEMLIYLKIWEADLMIKKLYELARIINGETYDWYFSVMESSRDKSATGTRQDIIRNLIRDKLVSKTKFLSDWITSIYKTQIRNSIAHSKYSIAGRTISLNNYIKEDPASQLHSLSFDEWHVIFHKLLLMHNEYLWLGNTINSIYVDKFNNRERIEILITEKTGKQYAFELDYRVEFNDWHYKNK